MSDFEQAKPASVNDTLRSGKVTAMHS